MSLHGAEISKYPSVDRPHMRTCARCGMRYDWRQSPSSSLKMTYCGSLCERADLGFTIDGLLAASYSLERSPPELVRV